jgi:hypothetical protein
MIQHLQRSTGTFGRDPYRLGAVRTGFLGAQGLVPIQCNPAQSWFVEDSCLIQDEPERGTGFSHKMSLNSGIGILEIDHPMDDSEATSLEQIQAFLAGSGEVRFAEQRRDEVYAWTERTLVRHQYAARKRREKACCAVHRPHDGPEPGTGAPADWRVCQQWAGESGGLPTPEIHLSLHQIRRGTAGLPGQESCQPNLDFSKQM